MGAWPAASYASAWPVECSTLSKKRCSLVCTPTFGSTWGRYLQTPLCLGLSLRCRPLAYGQARLRSRTRGWSRFYSPTSGLLSRRLGAAAPSPPLSAALGLSCRRLATAGNETLAILRAHLRTRKFIRCKGLQRRNVFCTHRRCRDGDFFYRSRVETPPGPPPLRCARLHLRCGRCRGQ